jgi:hypothetical protein
MRGENGSDTHSYKVSPGFFFEALGYWQIRVESALVAPLPEGDRMESGGGTH